MKKLLLLLCIFSVIAFSFAQTSLDTVPPPSEAVSLPSDTEPSLSDTAPPLSAWKEYWKFSGTVGLKISQTQLFNWIAGGNSNFAGIAFANLSLNYKKNKLAWDSNLDTDFGVIYSSEFIDPFKWRKANDKINFTTTFGYEISSIENTKSMWFVAANGSFKSQYTIGYNYLEDGSRQKLSN
jgi:hypothetical protein